MLFSTLVAFSLAADAPPVAEAAPVEESFVPGVEVEVLADPAVARARAKLFQDLRDQGYRRGDHKNDRTVFKSYTPYYPRVIVHDDGWVYLRREPPRVHAPGKSFSDQGSPAAYLWCILAPTACVSVGGLLISPHKLAAIKGDVLDAVHNDVNALNDAVARKQLELRVNNDIPVDCEQIWAQPIPAEARRRLLFTYWDSRLDTPEGDVARRAVMAFVKGVVMQSEEPFTEAEITEMNAQRQCSMPFDPQLGR